MTRWAPLATDVFDALAAEILARSGKGRAIVAVDGALGTGTPAFAAGLVDALRRRSHKTFLASLEDFHREVQKEVGTEYDVAGFGRSDYDYSLLKRALIDPFLMGGTGFQLKGFDRDRNVPFQSKWDTGPADAVLVIEGHLLLRPELRDNWHYTAWLRSDTVAVEKEYEREARPRITATAIFDVTDGEHPRRSFADAC